MFDRKKNYSYAAQKHQRHRLLILLAGFVAFFIVYNCITTFFISVWVVDNDNMMPGLSSGDRVIFSSILSSQDDPHVFKRGSIVLVDKGNIRNRNVPMRFLDSIVRFFTLQRASIFSRDSQYYIKRIIAVPGDEIFMNNFVFRVKPAGSSFNLTEFELSEKPYHPAIPNIPAIWDESIPFSSSMEAITLGHNEYFLISDDRSNTNDSRTWGAVSPSLIKARARLRFWPIMKFELL